MIFCGQCRIIKEFLEKGKGVFEMLFCSEEFLFLFLPIFLILYYLMPTRWRNLTLLLGSLLFYLFGERRWFFLLLFSIALHYVATRAMRRRSRGVQRGLLAGLLVYDFATLFFFKYVNLIFPQWGLTLPLGISFYTFQIAAYAIDVYRGQKPADSFVTLGAYVSMFPQLISGPIVLFNDVRKQLKQRVVHLERLQEGLKVFVIGLSYKVLIADVLGNLWHEIQVVGVDSISGAMAWLGAFAYSLQLYFDFNGYSIMAIGLGLMLGFKLPRNFQQPYTAVSVTDFWRRWHMTLTNWFREYLYIPLGGSREGTFKTIRNLFIVWLFTGLWHGSGLTFLLWGMYYFLFLVVEKFFTRKFWEKHKALGHVYALLVAVVGWVIFALHDLPSIGIYLSKMFLMPGDFVAFPAVTLDALSRYGLFFVVAAVCSTCVVENGYKRWKDTLWMKLLLLVLFWICVYRIVTAASNPFLYFGF